MASKRIHLKKNGKWYDRKKPKLQLDILSCLVLKGPLSKGKVESILKGTHPNILESFNKLEDKDFIKNIGRIPGRGRFQNIYKITKKGLETLIVDEITNSLNFWKILFGYYNHHDNNKIEPDEIDKLFNIFLNKYLQYSNRNFTFQLEIFDKMSAQWFNKYVDGNKKEIRPEQRIVETLALNRNLTLEELAIKAKLKQIAIRKVLNSHSMEYFESITHLKNEYYVYQNVVGKKYNKKYWDFLQSNIIKVKKDNGLLSYELTLFGVILVLKLLRYKNLNRIKKELYFKNLPFLEYFEKIINNYKEKLSLIFGNWNQLKQILKIYAIYNFDIIIDEEFRTNDENKLSIARGGNKEFHYSIKEIILQTRQQFGDFANAGYMCWLNYIAGIKPENSKNNDYSIDYYLSSNYPENNKNNIEKVLNVKKKLGDIIISLNPLENIIKNQNISSKENLNKLSEYFEESFANEISSFYYFNLDYEYEFYNIINNKSNIHDNNNYFPKYSRPKECLQQILNSNKSIQNYYANWKNDIVNLQNNIYQNLKNE